MGPAVASSAAAPERKSSIAIANAGNNLNMPIPPWRSFADREAEACLCLVRVDRRDVPGHRIVPLRQRTDADTHHFAAGGRAVIDARFGCAAHFSAAEFGL